MGGLKTVDTDDALRAVYLRELKNLSLSEFGFIEKRYGIYKSDEFEFVNTNGDSINPFNISGKAGFIQGYFEYIDKAKRVHKIMIIDGVVYVKDPRPGSSYPTKFRAIDFYFQEPGFDYPSDEELEIGSDLIAVPDRSRDLSFELNEDFSYSYLAKDFSRPVFFFNINKQITFEAVDVQDKSSAFTLDLTLENFFQAVSQLEVEKSYAVNVSPVFGFNEIPQEDVERSYSHTIQSFYGFGDIGQISFIEPFTFDVSSNYTFDAEAIDFQFEDDAFTLSLSPSFTFVDSDFLTVNPPIVSTTNLNSTSTRLNISNQNNPFSVVARYTLTSTQPGQGDPGITLGGGNSGSVDLTSLSPNTPYTVYVRSFSEADPTRFSDPVPSSFTTCLAADTYLGYTCSGTTRINSYANGNCGTYTTSEANSATCGYVPPTPTLTAPTYQGSNTGTTTVQADYYNPNGVNATLTVYIILNGSLVDTEVTSISATNSASVNFGQLNPNTTYTLEAYLSASGYNTSSARIDTVTTDEDVVVCDPFGTYYGFYCTGTTRVNQFADGNCSIYESIEPNSVDCGYVEPPPPPTYTTSAQIARGVSGGSWFLSLSITYRGSSRAVQTDGITILDSAIAEGTSVTLSAPSSVNYNGNPYTFIRWRVNGVDQSQGVTSITRTINANTFFEPVYEPFGLG
jgi:hypothetical protein